MKKRDYKSKLHKLTLTIFLIVIIGLMFLSQNWFSNIKAKKVTVSGNYLLSRNEIIQMIKEDTSKKFDELDLTILENKIEKILFVKNSTVSKDALGNLEIEIFERTPFAMLSSNFGKNLNYISDDGILLPHRMLQNSIDVPLISLKNQKLKITGNKIANSEIISAIEFLINSKNENRTLYYNLSEISINENGSLIAYTNNKGLPIFVGKNNIENKVKNLNSFLTQFPVEYDSSKTKYIDVRFNEQIIIGTKNYN